MYAKEKKEGKKKNEVKLKLKTNSKITIIDAKNKNFYAISKKVICLSKISVQNFKLRYSILILR